MQKIELLGGAVNAIKSGYQISLIEENAYKIASKIESGEKRIVGLNCWLSPSENNFRSQSRHSSSEEITSRSISYKLARKVIFEEEKNELIGVATSAESNLIPSIKRCLLAGMTLGEICEILKYAWGNY
jgi:methylmalonyl-CoA mutase N-terminal domain/subunit